MKKIIPAILISACAIFTFACSSVPYKIDIDQGHLITPEKVSKLELGMSKKQVAIILGTPLLIDTFNQDRWDYPQYYRHGKTQEITEGRLALFFKDEKLHHINGNSVVDIQQEPVHYDNLPNPF